MGTMTKHNWMKKAAALALAPAAVFSISACSEDTAGPEEGAAVEDVVEEEPAAEEPLEDEGVEPYDGVYDSTFYGEYDSYIGEVVTVSAEVNEIISPNAFTIAGTDDTTVEELLIVHNLDAAEVEQGLTVAVTGTVEEAFVITDFEDEYGVDLDDELYADWEQQRYIDATGVDTSVNADAGEDNEG